MSKSPHIITPYNEDQVYVLNNSKGIPTFVMEVPKCRFQDLPVCLATNKKSEIPKVKEMCRRFASLWASVASGQNPMLKSG